MVRKATSVGLEVLGEYAHIVGNLAHISFMAQYIACQLINYGTYQNSNYQTQTFLEPMKSMVDSHGMVRKLLKFSDILLLMLCVGLPVYSTVVVYDNNWWLLTYKLFIICPIITYALQASMKLQFCICIFLYRTCKTLNSDIEQMTSMSTDCQNNIPVTALMNKFQSISVDMSNQNRYWKKMLFMVISTTLPLATTSAFATLELKSTILKVIGLIAVLQVMVATSVLVLMPAHLELKLRKCYPLMCRLLRHRPLNWTLKLKLLRLIKQYDNQISFTIWDTNKLDYFDYIEVRICS